MRFCMREMNFFLDQASDSMRYYQIIQINITTMSEKLISTDLLITQQRPATTSYGYRRISFHKMKQLKQSILQMDEEYKRKLTQLKHTQKSIDKSNREAQKTKVNFLKLYEKKKMKLFIKNQIQNKQIEDKQVLQNAVKNVKTQRIMSELQMAATKQELEEVNMYRTEKYRKEKQLRRNQIKVRSKSEFMKAKQQYFHSKSQKQSLNVRKQRIEEMLYLKGKRNYQQKLEKELEMINSYDEILNKVNEGNVVEEDERPSTSFSKSFFITCRKMESSSKKRDQLL